MEAGGSNSCPIGIRWLMSEDDGGSLVAGPTRRAVPPPSHPRHPASSSSGCLTPLLPRAGDSPGPHPAKENEKGPEKYEMAWPGLLAGSCSGALGAVGVARPGQFACDRADPPPDAIAPPVRAVPNPLPPRFFLLKKHFLPVSPPVLRPSPTCARRRAPPGGQQQGTGADTLAPRP